MQPIDSKKKTLTFPEVVGHAITGSGLKGMELAKAIYMTLEEMKMPTAEAINVKNTVFLGHFTQDKKTAYLKVFNVDTYKNFLGNLEVYLRDAANNGTDMFVYPYTDNSADAVFNHLRKKSIATVETRKDKDGKMIAIIMLDPELVEAPEKNRKKTKKNK